MPAKKISLQIGNGTPVEVQRGRVFMTGSTVVIEETPADGNSVLVDAYVLREGDRVRRVAEGEYVVEH